MDTSPLSGVDPYWALVLLVPGIYAALFRILGLSRTNVIVLWGAGMIGFALGQMLADRSLLLTDVRLGGSQIVESTLAAWVSMLIANRVRL